MNRVIRSSVIGKGVFFFAASQKNGNTEPLEPITLPYRTTENLVGLEPA